MNRLIALLLLALPSALASVTLVEGGKPAASIVIPRGATGVERYAAEELRDHIEMATGARLAIVESAPAGARVLSPRAEHRSG